jgi:hypothetical protein
MNRLVSTGPAVSNGFAAAAGTAGAPGVAGAGEVTSCPKPVAVIRQMIVMMYFFIGRIAAVIEIERGV